MFQGLAGLTMDGDHLDISYNDPDRWPKLNPSGSIRAFIFHAGDVEKGPCFQLGLIRPVEGETLDWRHGIDPLHHHGSDQFRAIVTDGWNLAGRRLQAGDYAFQEAGIVYQEHPGPDGAGATLLVMADRRGNQATIARKRDEEAMFEYEDVYGAPRDGTPYPHPAGDRGIAAVNTTAGRCENGYLRGRTADLESGPAGALTGVLGDAEAGPSVHVLRADPGETIVPAATWPTETVLLTLAGSVDVGGCAYPAGTLRVQRGDAPMEAITAGADGAELVFVVADRRASVVFAEKPASVPAWLATADALLASLEPVAGGLRAAQRVAAS